MNVKTAKEYLSELSAAARRPSPGNELGGAILLTMLTLVLLTFLGIGTSKVATIQQRMAGNDRAVKQGLYLAESAAMEAVQIMENDNGTELNSGSVPWINSRASVINHMDAEGWLGPASSPSGLESDTRFAAVDLGIALGSSIGKGGSNLRHYKVLGRFGGRRGRCLVEVGYKKRH